MNNEEKKPLDSEEVVEQQAPDTPSKDVGKTNDAPKKEAPKKSSKKGVNKAAIAGIVGGVLVIVVAVVFALVLILGANNGNNGGNNNNNGTSGGDSETNNVTYTISVATKGGMMLSNLPVYIHEYEDGMIGEIIHYVATDATGKATVSLPEEGQYAANISIGLPDGYDADAFYPLVSTNLNIEISSELLPDKGLSGVSYSLGSVMHDFTVTTTTGDVFTLSEVLKEKKAVLINFWYTECSWCVTEFPIMQKVYEEYKDDLAIIALDPPTINNDTIYDITQFKSNYSLTFDVALDEQGLFSAFNVEGYPTSAIIDRYGVVTLIEAGAITSERAFDVLFDFFTADDYKQQLVVDYSDIVPKEKPNVSMPSSDEISSVFDKGAISGIQYIPYRDSASDSEKEYSWPFVIDEVQFGGVDSPVYQVIKTSNANKENSFAQMIFNVELKAGEVLAFDYYSFTELGADILYVVVDEKDIYSISGQNENGWETCYAFVAEEDGTYEVGLVYQKDSDTNYEHDTVFLKDLRIVTESEIDRDTYIYRFAVTKPDGFGAYTEYVEIYLGADGYYHVDSPTGPILLADLMSYTRFSDESTVYYMAADLLAAGNITAAEYNKIIDYCNYASNSRIYGASSVNEELRTLLTKISYYLGVQSDENDWLRFCFYYDAYGTDGKQLEDPIKGLAFFSAQNVVVSNKGDTDFPNSFKYDRVIMPRGYIAKFTPSVSGTYLITSNAPDPNKEGYGLETDAWIFVEDAAGQRALWYTYENIDRSNVYDTNNCYMVAYFEAGKDYYIDIAFYDVYEVGTINFRVERLGGEGYYRFSLASPGYFTTLDDGAGGMKNWLVHGGIDVVLGEDGIWREKREDGVVGSILYADFTQATPIITSGQSLTTMIDMGAFNFALSEGDQYILNYLAMNDNDPDKCTEYLKKLWGADYETYAEIYDIEEVYAGIWHGNGTDYTEKIREYLDDVITVGYNAQLGETISAGDDRIGCVVVTAELAEILQLFMDKHTLMNGDGENVWSIENSWTKLCYYSQYFCAATPN